MRSTAPGDGLASGADHAAVAVRRRTARPHGTGAAASGSRSNAAAARASTRDVASTRGRARRLGRVGRGLQLATAGCRTGGGGSWRARRWAPSGRRSRRARPPSAARRSARRGRGRRPAPGRTGDRGASAPPARRLPAASSSRREHPRAEQAVAEGRVGLALGEVHLPVDEPHPHDRPQVEGQLTGEPALAGGVERGPDRSRIGELRAAAVGTRSREPSNAWAGCASGWS